MIPGAMITLVRYRYQGFEADIELLWASASAKTPNGLIIHINLDGCCLRRMQTNSSFLSAQDAIMAGEALVRFFVSVNSGKAETSVRPFP